MNKISSAHKLAASIVLGIPAFLIAHPTEFIHGVILATMTRVFVEFIAYQTSIYSATWEAQQK